MGITKNQQSESAIRRMAQAAFPEKELTNIAELTEGMCNAAYRVRFSDDSESVLKIAPGDGTGLMSNEIHMMAAEVRAMRLVREKEIVKVADVQYYDTSRTLCSGDYFFMEALEGQSFFAVRDTLTEQEKSSLHCEVGEISRRLTTIRGKKFGLLGDEAHPFDTLFDFVYYLMKNVLTDVQAKEIVIGVPREEILTKLHKDRTVFDQVQTPTLVHWDMWEGNIFVNKGRVSGIIDWERALWGESFMDDRFRRHTRNDDFLKGYGQEAFSQQELRRILWYDVFLYLTMMAEGAYRGYEDDGQYRWVKPLFEASWGELNG